MYGENCRYRSGLNPSMIAHLASKVEKIKSYGVINGGDIFVDIGANDLTTLQQYKLDEGALVGIDPAGGKFSQYYTKNIKLIADFFNAAAFEKAFPGEHAKVVTLFSVFYDMEDPLGFMREVAQILDNKGVWVCEQSYMPLMLEANSCDTACHEHFEYYALAQILWMADRSGLEIADVEPNDGNGGSFSFVAQRAGGPLTRTQSVKDLIAREEKLKLDNLKTFADFFDRVKQSRIDLLDFLIKARAKGKKVGALGAFTKSNVLLQYCGIDESLVFAIGKINPDKFGAHALGTLIPIIDEKEMLTAIPVHVLVLPWNFRAFFEGQSRYADVNRVYPLPGLSVL